MRYRIFGRRTGLRVSEVALGTGNFGTGWGHGAEPAEARRMFDGFLAAGGNFIDSADSYQGGQSEELLAEMIRAERDNLVLATKFTLPIGNHGRLLTTGNSRKTMMRAVEQSLKRLKTDRIDLYWVHLDDQVTPMAEILRGLDDLVRAGKIHYAALSNFPAWRVARADLMAELRGWSPIAGIQIEYSLAERAADRELLPMAEALGLGVAMWSPLGGGFLTGKYRQSDEGRLKGLGMLVHTEKSARETAILDAVLDIAKETGAPPAHVAIAWLRHKAEASTTALIPILGPRNREQLDATLGALELTLSPDQIARLDQVSAVPLGTLHDMALAYRPRVFGGKLEQMAMPAVPVA